MFRIFFIKDGAKLWLVDYKNDKYGPVFSHSPKIEDASHHTPSECDEIIAVIKQRYQDAGTFPERTL